MGAAKQYHCTQPEKSLAVIDSGKSLGGTVRLPSMAMKPLVYLCFYGTAHRAHGRIKMMAISDSLCTARELTLDAVG